MLISKKIFTIILKLIFPCFNRISRGNLFIYIFLRKVSTISLESVYSNISQFAHKANKYEMCTTVGGKHILHKRS
jgi:hypothetical protein